MLRNDNGDAVDQREFHPEQAVRVSTQRCLHGVPEIASDRN